MTPRLTFLTFLAAGLSAAASRAAEKPSVPEPAAASAVRVLPASDPDNQGGWQLVEQVSDEFNGAALDLQKWNNLGLHGNYHGEWKGRAPSQYDPANVSVGGGNLVISSKWNPDFPFAAGGSGNGFEYGRPAPVTTAAIITKARFHYGYLEMRCQAADGPVSSSFWTTGRGGELDVFEHFGENPANPHSAKRFQASFHDWRKGSAMFGKRIWTHDHQLDFRVAGDFHVYGMEWNPEFVTLHVDGRRVHRVTRQDLGDKWVATEEQKVWIDSETFDWEVKPARLTAGDFGDGRRFVVDYCRVWQRTRPAAEETPQVNLLANPGFESGLTAWSGEGVVSGETRSGQSAAALTKAGGMEQTVKVKPATTYILSAWVKSPGTNQADRWCNGFLGVKDYGAAAAETRFFFPDFHQKSLQFTTGATATTAVIYLTNRPQGNQVMVDDLILVEAPAPARPGP